MKNARAQTLKSKFESMNMKETEKFNDFCMRLNGLMINIRALGETVEKSCGEEAVLAVFKFFTNCFNY